MLDDDEALARNTDPDTSHAAADAVKVAELEARVIEALKIVPSGLTNNEIADMTKIEVGSVSPRMKPLETKLLVTRTDGRRIPKGRRRSQIIWRLRAFVDQEQQLEVREDN